VLVPAYNTATTIGEAVDSALSQSPQPHEVIVSDDGSEDDLAAALKPFRESVRVVRGPNAGLATARNRASAVATGELLALLDADDVWLPGRVDALMTAAAARPDLAVLTTDAIETWEGVPSPKSWYATLHFEVAEQELAILQTNFIFGAGAVRTDAFRSVGGYRSGARYAEDWDLWTRLLLTGHRAGLIDRPLYEYRRRVDSLMGHKVDLALGVLDLLAKARGHVTTEEQRRQLQRTTQHWRQVGTKAAWGADDPRARRMSLLAAAGPLAPPGVRLRYGAAALLPRRLVADRLGPRSDY
jgi:glycosyltransferase involved in cell wall biosynthesis